MSTAFFSWGIDSLSRMEYWQFLEAIEHELGYKVQDTKRLKKAFEWYKDAEYGWWQAVARKMVKRGIIKKHNNIKPAP